MTASTSLLQPIAVENPIPTFATPINAMNIENPVNFNPNDNTSSFHLHANESPTLKLMSLVLDSNNYHEWARAMKMALFSKNKFGFWSKKPNNVDEASSNSTNQFSHSGNTLSGSSVLLAKRDSHDSSRRYYPNNKPKHVGSYCRFTRIIGHTIEKCYKKHGYALGGRNIGLPNQVQANTHHQVQMAENYVSVNQDVYKKYLEYVQKEKGTTLDTVFTRTTPQANTIAANFVPNAQLKVHSGQMAKFSSRVRRCLFLGYTNGTKGYKLYDTQANEAIVSKDVFFYEDVFPFQINEDRTLRRDNTN
nr:uncharacterized protein LOC109166032 [Ipomoea batatas]